MGGHRKGREYERRLPGGLRPARLLLHGAQQEKGALALPRWRVEVQERCQGRRSIIEPALLVVGMGQALQPPPLVSALAELGDGAVDGHRLFRVALVAQLVGQVEVKWHVGRWRRERDPGRRRRARRLTAAAGHSGGEEHGG